MDADFDSKGIVALIEVALDGRSKGEQVDALEDLAAELLERADEIRASLNAPAEGDADALEAEEES
jgi:hypothetical protein